MNRMPVAAGTRLGPYEILGRIGAGGMGEVFKATDTRLNRMVAIKVSREQFSERFEREARAVAALNHSNICTLHDIGPDYLVMEYIEGAALKGPLPLDQAVKYASQICDALDAAHKKGIVHRDLKPANILVTKAGIKLLDFGLAKQCGPLEEDDDTRALTREGTIAGTLNYMAPEQLQGKSNVDSRADIFAFGCVLYEMLTGKRAFDGPDRASVMVAVMERPAPSITGIAPAALDRVLKRCLAKDPDERWRSAWDLKWALAGVGEGGAEKPKAPAKGLLYKGVFTIAAVSTLAAVSLAFLYFRGRPADDRALKLAVMPPERGQFAFGAAVGGIALSPDGRNAAFVATVDRKTTLWVQALEGAAAKPLPGTEDAFSPFWSPDGKSIGFFAGDVRRLLRVEATGGTPLAICQVTGARGGTWTSDGQIIFGTIATGLLRVSASGGTPSPLTALEASRGESSHRWPQMLPKGRLLFWSQCDKAENDGVFLTSLAKPSERTLILKTSANALYAPGGDGRNYLLWLRGGTLLAQEFDADAARLTGDPRVVADPVASTGTISQMDVAVSGSGLLLYSASNPRRQFTWLDLAGKILGTVGEPDDYFFTFRLSPDGRNVAATRSRATRGSDLWLLNVDRGLGTRFTSRPGISIVPVWSPDGRNIVFGSGTPRNLYRKQSSGDGEDERLTESRNPQVATDWSRDGRFLLYSEIAQGTNLDLWVQPVTPEGKRAGDARPWLRTPFNKSSGRFSPDSRWVAYESDESGRYEVYIDSFPNPRSKTRISSDGGDTPEWGPDGRHLFYVSPDGKLMTSILNPRGDSLESSAARELFAMPGAALGGFPYEVGPDGKRFLVLATPRNSVQPLTVIANWPALLKKATAAQ
jgi:eukaryotic-like serine/threonine-protein kinase